MNALDVIEKEISGQKQPGNLRNGVAQVIAAMTRTIDAQGLWPQVWGDLHDVQGIRRNKPQSRRRDGRSREGHNRVRTLLSRAALAHAHPARE